MQIQFFKGGTPLLHKWEEERMLWQTPGTLWCTTALGPLLDAATSTL